MSTAPPPLAADLTAGLRRLKLAAMRRQECKHAVGLQKMTGNRFGIQQLTLIISTTLHPSMIPKPQLTSPPPR